MLGTWRGAGCSSSAYKWARGAKPPIPPSPSCLLALHSYCSIHGTYQEILCRREGKGSAGGLGAIPAEEGPRPPPMGRRDTHCHSLSARACTTEGQCQPDRPRPGPFPRGRPRTLRKTRPRRKAGVSHPTTSPTGPCRWHSPRVRGVGDDAASHLDPTPARLGGGAAGAGACRAVASARRLLEPSLPGGGRGHILRQLTHDPRMGNDCPCRRPGGEARPLFQLRWGVDAPPQGFRGGWQTPGALPPGWRQRR